MEGEDGKLLECANCPKVFMTMQHYMAHCETHKEGYDKNRKKKLHMCKICGVPSQFRSKLKRHLKTHKLTDEELMKYLEENDKEQSCAEELEATNDESTTSPVIGSVKRVPKKSTAASSTVAQARVFGSSLQFPQTLNQPVAADNRGDEEMEGISTTELNVPVIKQENTEQYGDEMPVFVKQEPPDTFTSSYKDSLDASKDPEDVKVFSAEPTFSSDQPMLGVDQIKREEAEDDMEQTEAPNTRNFNFRVVLNEPNVERVEEGQKSFKCGMCDETFHEMDKLIEHTMKHGDANFYYCSECDKSFASQEILKLHMEEHLKKKQFECTICGIALTSQKILDAHLMLHSGDRPYECEECGKKFTTTGYLSQHKKTHNPDKAYSCTVCGKSFNVLSYLNSHVERIHGKKLFHCDRCGKGFRYAGILERHMEVHSEVGKYKGRKDVQCEICERFFSSKDCLKQHMSVHTGEQPFECTVCKKTFVYRSSLSAHMKTHYQERKFKCDQCEWSFAWRTGLKNHYRRKHAGDISRDHKCDMCDKAFYGKHELVIHQRVHTKEKPYQCPNCQKGFSQRGNMRLHMRQHEKEGKSEGDTEQSKKSEKNCVK